MLLVFDPHPAAALTAAIEKSIPFRQNLMHSLAHQFPGNRIPSGWRESSWPREPPPPKKRTKTATQHRGQNRRKIGIYFSRCSRHIRSLATFSFFARIFLRFSTEFWLSTKTVKHPPVVVFMFNVICDCDRFNSAPHPNCWCMSWESLPILRWFFFASFCFLFSLTTIFSASSASPWTIGRLLASCHFLFIVLYYRFK